jgi:hypothetical protein
MWRGAVRVVNYACSTQITSGLKQSLKAGCLTIIFFHNPDQISGRLGYSTQHMPLQERPGNK